MTNVLTPRDYCTTPEEAAKIGRGLVMIRKIACVEKDEARRNAIFEAGWNFWNFSHVWDDLIDGSGWPEEKKMLALKAMQQFVVSLLKNPVYLENAGGFESLFVTGIARAIAGEQFAASKDPKERCLAPAIKCADIDIMVFLAHIAGGWKFAQEMSSKNELRKYDSPDPEPTQPTTT